MKSFVAHATLAAALAVGAACGRGPQTQAADTSAASRDLVESAEPERAQTTEERLPPGPPVAPPADSEGLDISSLGVDRGSPDAPVRIVEFSDYGCGYCRKFHQETWPVLAKDFVDTGKVEWKFLPFVLGMFDNSSHALLAAECALEQGMGPFEDMNGRIWDDQQTWKKSSDAARVLRGFAEEAGLDLKRYGGGGRDGRIAAANQLARQVGVRGTPTFFIVGYPPIQGALPTETFRKVLDMVYADATGNGAN
jgi:protein-disulfide isomerase